MITIHFRITKKKKKSRKMIKKNKSFANNTQLYTSSPEIVFRTDLVQRVQLLYIF